MERDAINSATRVNGEIARLLLHQSSEFLRDVLEAKKQYETKASVLFAGYVTAAVALMGVATLADVAFDWAFVIAGAIFAVAAGLASWALRDRDYGAHGIEPDQWLTAFYLTEADDALEVGRIAALITYDLQDSIDLSMAYNDEKANAISAALFFSYFGAALAMLAALAQFVR